MPTVKICSTINAFGTLPISITYPFTQARLFRLLDERLVLTWKDAYFEVNNVINATGQHNYYSYLIIARKHPINDLTILQRKY